MCWQVTDRLKIVCCNFPSLLATSSYSGQLVWALEASQEAPQLLGGLDSMLSVLTLEEQIELAIRLSTAGAGLAGGQTLQAKAIQPHLAQASPAHTAHANPAHTA